MMSVYESCGQHYIDGEWLTGQGESFSSINPLTNENHWQGHSANLEEVQRAVAAAQKSFTSWSRLSVEARQQYVESFAKVVTSKKQELAEIIHRETGKPLWESLTEAASVVGKVGLSIQAYELRTGFTHHSQADVASQLSHRALGVMAILGPYNFPAHLPNGHIVPALLAGNTIVFKPSELTPLTAEFMLQCWQEAGIPQGVINLIQGAGETGKLLSQHAAISGLLFTGSSTTGTALHKQFGGQPGKMLALEMGGNNPLVVHQTSDVTAAVYTIIQSAFISAGQRCTCARRLILIDDEEGQAILSALLSALKKLKVGKDIDSFMGPVIRNSIADKLLSVQQQWQEQGVPLLTPGVIDTTSLVQRQDEEFFGPLLQVIKVEDFSAAIDEANNTRFGLSAGLLSDNRQLWQEFFNRSRAGIVNWNKQITGASGAAPFGGIGASGNYRPSAFYAADYCAYPVASMQSEHLKLPAELTLGVVL
ncbi:N-succinylglutamate 5-semialdehyde dehydrogenase [Thalassocella blandensis]|nr:N-succinylglutamate 5-semialdehyde dehydrogenase [Thalassocella blandensis]